MVIDWKSFSFTQKEANEDIWYADSEQAWVLDGASGLYKECISGMSSDAAWYVRQIDAFLKMHLLDERPIVDIMKEAVVQTAAAYRRFPGYACVQDVPSAAAAVVRIKGDVLEYFVLADCEILIEELNGNILKFTDDRVSVLDERAIQAAAVLAKRTQRSILECMPDIQDIKAANRKMKNQSGGYYALCDDAAACEEALTGTCSLQKLQSLCLCSDGFAQYYQTMQVVKNKEELFQHLHNYTLDEMHERLFQKQLMDKDLNTYPRFRLSDDNTMVYGSIKKDL